MLLSEPIGMSNSCVQLRLKYPNSRLNVSSAFFSQPSNAGTTLGLGSGGSCAYTADTNSIIETSTSGFPRRTRLGSANVGSSDSSRVLIASRSADDVLCILYVLVWDAVGAERTAGHDLTVADV